MICKNCGKETPNDSLFCQNCGSRLEEEPMQNEDIGEQEIVELNEQGEADLDSDNGESISDDTGAEISSSENQKGGGNPEKQKPKNLKQIIICCCIGVIALIAVSIVFYQANYCKDMKEALANRSAYQVNSLYSEAYSKPSKLEKYDELIGETLDDIYNGLNSYAFHDEALTSGYTAPYNYLEDYWGTLAYTDDEYGETLYSSVSMSNMGKWQDIEELTKSKSLYCAGICYNESYGQYTDAIDCFSQVIQSDSDYQNAQAYIGDCAQNYLSQTLTEVDSLISDGDVNGGIQKLEAVKSYFDSNGLDSEAVQTKINEILVSYAQSYADKAEEMFKQHDVNAAIGNIEVAMELQPDNAVYKAKYDTYQQYLPFYMYIKDNCLNINKSGDFSWYMDFDRERIANDNTPMPHSISWYSQYHISADSVDATYNVAGKYDIITGTLFIANDDKNSDICGWFKVYGDGKLLYESDKMKSGVLPKDFSVNISGIQKLTISFYNEGESYTPVYISNLTAQKNFPE